MMHSVLNIGSKKLKLPNALKKNGFATFRFYFTGYERNTNDTQRFFIEASMVNPYLSPQDVVLGFASNVKFSEEDLQYALAGTESSKTILTEELLKPSYFAVRIGMVGRRSKQLCTYHSMRSSNFSLAPFLFEAGDCKFSESEIIGKISRSIEDTVVHPEFFCDDGNAIWNLSYKINYSAPKNGYAKGNEKWILNGLITNFTGIIIFDGREYHVDERTCLGYSDYTCGESYPMPLIHLSSSNLTSVITGKYLADSCFAVHGDYQGRVSLVARIEDRNIVFFADKINRQFVNGWNCIIMPENDEEEKLHWSVSVSDKKWIVDIDVYCATKDLLLRKLELPGGNRKTIEVLCGGNGTGVMKVYMQGKKNIELVEENSVENVFCELGRGSD